VLVGAQPFEHGAVALPGGRLKAIEEGRANVQIATPKGEGGLGLPPERPFNSPNRLRQRPLYACTGSPRVRWAAGSVVCAAEAAGPSSGESACSSSKAAAGWPCPAFGDLPSRPTRGWAAARSKSESSATQRAGEDSWDTH
jgi:hypothetical protein